MTPSKLALLFIDDFSQCTFGELCDRWQYKELPTAKEIVDILAANHELEKYVDLQPKDGVFPYFVLKKDDGYEFFYWFRNMKVSERYFEKLEDAVKEKFQYALDAIWGGNR